MIRQRGTIQEVEKGIENREEHMWKPYIRKYLREMQELKYCKFGWIEETKGERNGVSW